MLLLLPAEDSVPPPHPRAASVGMVKSITSEYHGSNGWLLLLLHSMHEEDEGMRSVSQQRSARLRRALLQYLGGALSTAGFALLTW